MEILYKGITYNSGDIVVGTIRDIFVYGKLNISNNTRTNGSEIVHFCHDNPEVSGDTSPDKHGFKYSWAFFKDNRGLTDSVELIGKINKISDISISDEVSKFLIMANPLLTTLISNCSSIKNFNRVEYSDTKGMIKLLNTESNRSTEMKFGRLLRSIDFDFDSNLIDIDDKNIESTHNKYLVYQKGDSITIEELNGEDILFAYESKNHLMDKNRGNLSGSCMNNKLDYLGLYTKNKEVVNLLVVKQFDKIAGRAVIWNLPDGRRAIDRRYVSGDWATEKIRKYTTDNGLINVDDLDDIDIEIDVTGLSEFPYLDTFFYVNIEEGSNSATISNYDDDCQKFFRSTEGHLQNRN